MGGGKDVTVCKHAGNWSLLCSYGTKYGMYSAGIALIVTRHEAALGNGLGHLLAVNQIKHRNVLLGE